MGWLRHPRAAQEKRASQYTDDDGYIVKIKRKAKRIVSVYDDIQAGTQRSWKKRRKAQYH